MDGKGVWDVRKPCRSDVAIILGLMYKKIDSYSNCYKILGMQQIVII